MLGRNEGTQPMRAMTIRQPWASLVVLGVKRVETRSWRAPAALIGQRIAIHASAKVPPLVTFVGDYHVAQGSTWLHGPGVDVRMAFGAVVGSAVLTTCVPMVDRWPAPGGRNHTPLVPLLYVGENYPPTLWAKSGEREGVDVSDQLPYGVFESGRWAWIFTDATPTTERCLACSGTGDHDGGWDPIAEEWIDEDLRLPCTVCDGEGRCAPVPAKGRLGLWRWEP